MAHTLCDPILDQLSLLSLRGR